MSAIAPEWFSVLGSESPPKHFVAWGRRIFPGLLLLFVASAGSLPLFGQLPVARVTHLFPPGGKAGTSFELKVAGSDLDDPASIHFLRDGITAVPKGGGPEFVVTIASNVPPGSYEARFVGRFGISNPRPFVVGGFPETVADPTNTTAASAQRISVNRTINGRTAPNSVAWFKFTARKSQRLFIECVAESIDSRLDPMLVLQDAAGHELEHARTGGLIDFTPPADGAYFLRLSDFLYRGGDAYFYRLTLSNAPRLDFVLPPAGLPGIKTNFLLFGRNLPGGKPVKGATLDGKPLEQLAVEIKVSGESRSSTLQTESLVRPGDSVVDGFDYRFAHAKGTSNPVRISFATAPVMLEQEPNDKPAQAQKLVPPCEVGGQFHPATEQDWFTFEAKKGEVLWIEIFSQRLGLPTDPFLLVQHVRRSKEGKEEASDVLELYDHDTNIGEREFNTATRDPSARFEAKEDGTYRLLVRDLFQRTERSPRFVYRLSLRKETPDFRLVAMALAPKLKADAKNIDLGVPLLRRGETIAVRVMAFRRDGFNGDIQLALENPPPGLIFEGDVIPAGKSSDVILLTAAENAPEFAGSVRLIGRARIGDRERVREARSGTLVFPVGNIDNERPESRLAREFALAISARESAPITIAAAERKVWESPGNAKLQVPLEIIRRGEFNAALKLKPLGPGTPEALKEFDVEAKATNATLTLDLAALKLASGDHVFAVQTQTTGKYRNNPEAAEFAEAAAREAEARVKERRAHAQKSEEELAAAVKAARDAEAAAATGREKLEAARTALEKSPVDEKLTAERDAAEQSATELAAHAKSTGAAKAAAEKANAMAKETLKDAEAKKEAATANAKRAVDKAKPRDVSILVYSPPIRVRVTAPADQAKGK